MNNRLAINTLELLNRLDESLNAIIESKDMDDDFGDVHNLPQPKKAPIPKIYISKRLDGHENAPKDTLVKFTRARKDYSGKSLERIEKGQTVIVPADIPIYVTTELFPYTVDRVLAAVYAAGYEGGTSPYKFYRGHGTTYRVFAWYAPTSKSRETEFLESLEDNEEARDVSKFQEPSPYHAIQSIPESARREYYITETEAANRSGEVRTWKSGDSVTVDGNVYTIFGFNVHYDCLVFRNEDWMILSSASRALTLF